MYLEDIKEELRNKQWDLCVAVIASAVAFVSASVVSVAGLSAMVAAFASFSLGQKDWGSGRKFAGVLSCLFALFLFLAGSGFMDLRECFEIPDTEAAMAECQSLQLSLSHGIRRVSGISFFWFVLNPFLWHDASNRLRRPGTFTAQHGVEEETKKPTRWSDKEKGFEKFVLKELERAGIGARRRYEWVCDVRNIAPETHDGGTRYEWEASRQLTDAPWYSVYQLVEQCAPAIGFLHRDHFVRRINEHLREAQIGWMFENGNWARVGDEIGDANLAAACSASSALGTEDAAKDLENAWKLCNQPGGGYEKDAVTAAMRALERIVQDRTGQHGTVLYRIKWQGPNAPHKMLRGVINTLYRYSSDQARHANEGAAVTAKDAHFVVSVAGALIVYLSDRDPSRPENQIIASNEHHVPSKIKEDSKDTDQHIT